jgi:hypothetical protein
MGLNFKMMPTMMMQQQLVAQTLLCSVQGIDAAMNLADPSAVLVDGNISEKYQNAIPRFVDAAIPYCTCLYRKANKNVAKETKSILGQCGLPPRLE